jgi:hypothetical protein
VYLGIVSWFVMMAAITAQQPVSPALDFEFFRTHVQPIFVAKRPAHARCIACHAGTATSSKLRLQRLPAGATTWSVEDSRKNFDSVARTVRPGNLQSRLLMHPLATEAGGDFFHSGGKHFSSQDNPEWQTLKAFVMGQTASTEQK